MIFESGIHIFGISVRQTINGNFLSVSDLRAIYEAGRKKYGWSRSSVSQVMQTKLFASKCYAMLCELGINKTTEIEFNNLVDSCGVLKVLKDYNLYHTIGRGQNKQVVAHPNVWIIIALELHYMICIKITYWLCHNKFNRWDDFVLISPEIIKLQKTNSNLKHILKDGNSSRKNKIAVSASAQ